MDLTLAQSNQIANLNPYQKSQLAATYVKNDGGASTNSLLSSFLSSSPSGAAAASSGPTTYSGAPALTSSGMPTKQQFQDDPNIAQFGTNPFVSPLADSIAKYQASGPGTVRFSPLSSSAIGQNYQAKDMSSVDLPQYDAMRSRLNSQYSQQQGQAQDALDRQFAAMGGGPGNGAQAKQTENLSASTEAQKSQDIQGINAQEAQTRTDLQQQEAQKEFQSTEAGRQAGLQLGEFNQGQSMAAQQFNIQSGQQFNAAMIDANSKLADMNLGWDQSEAEAYNNEFNKEMAQYQEQHSGGLFGGGGFLGLGI